ncbi:hypothetical protein L1987_76203 [Smallanthus sonchifolius]|uniref:Uncharacterized protein n=1 Tax=Smallanthus sonchifolius TaxID=185202 RepID=A0ACB9A8J1_9ASTR|nr:hypothetical protein L1987_76203 [Smallanthus sonchifolius]
MPERTELNDDGVDLVKSYERNLVEAIESLIQEDCVKVIEVEHESSANDDSEVKLDEEDEVFEGDWQGIVTTELEKSFEAAVTFVDCINLIGNEVNLQLYWLHSVAIEGSCFEPQPMALNVSAHANRRNNDMKLYLGWSWQYI